MSQHKRSTPDDPRGRRQRRGLWNLIKSILDGVQHARAPQGGRRIEQASPIDRRSTKSRSSRFWKRSNEMAQGMQNTLRNMYKTYGKYAGNGTKMNENRCPEASKEQVGGRTQCAKQRLKYLQNVSKIIENRGLEGSKIKENRDLEGSSGSSWHVWRDSVRIFDEVGHQMCEVGAKMAPSWAPDGP